MDALLKKYQALYGDTDDAHCSNTNARNVKTEPADNVSCNSSDINQAEWDAVKEVEDNFSDEEETDNTLSQDAENNMISALETLAKDLFQTPRSKGSSLNSLARSNTTSSKTSVNFDNFYEKSCKEFLQSRDDRLNKQRRQKVDEENKMITHKPNLVSKQGQKKHVSLVEKAKAMEIRKTQALEKAKREREEQEKKELENLTFKPNINEISKALNNYNSKEEVIERLYQGKGVGKEKANNEDETEKLFKPNINKKSSNLAKNVINKTSSKVEDRLLLQASATQAKKAKLAEASMPKFAPKLNKTTRKIIEQYSNREPLHEPKANGNVPQSLDNRFDLQLSLKKLSEVFDENYGSKVAPKTDRPSSKKPRTDESTENNDFSRNLQFDDNLIGNLQQLTMLLQTDDVRPNSTRNERYY